ncbi:MAG: cysteine desulfurase family protein [bacterium]
MNAIYLDHLSGTPVHPAVVEAMVPYLRDNFGNPQSMHMYGESAKSALEDAREKVAKLINAQPEEIYFTSSGTESNNFAVKGIASAYQTKGKHIVVSAIEHQSVLYSAKHLEKDGFSITLIPVDPYGVVNPDDVAKAIRSDTILVSVMVANNEVGTIEPVAEIANVVKEKGIIFHTDAVAAAGTIPLDVKSLNVDAMSLAANQFYGPKGAGALYIRKGVRIIPFIDGGIQEDGRRAGTENVPGIVGFGKAAELAAVEMADRSERLRKLRDTLIQQLPKKIEHIFLTGHPHTRLPHHASFCVEFIEGEAMLLMLSMEGIAVSSGSACTSRALKASHVLTAMNIPAALAQGSILFGFGVSNSDEDVEKVIKDFPPIVSNLRKMSPLYTKFKQEKKNEMR